MSLEFFWLVVNVLLSNFIVNYTVKSDKINRELLEIYIALFPNPINTVQTDGSDIRQSVDLRARAEKRKLLSFNKACPATYAPDRTFMQLVWFGRASIYDIHNDSMRGRSVPEKGS